MTDAEFRNLQREIENIILDMRALRTKIQDLDTHGTAVVQVQLSNMTIDIAELKAAFLREGETKAADRRVMLGALLAAATSLGLAILGVIINIATRKP